MQELLDNIICANFLEARNRGKFLEGSTLALCNQPTEEELSPRLRKHSSGVVLPCNIACQIVIIDAKNSKQLFLF
jgi:hypothetical protein